MEKTAPPSKRQLKALQTRENLLLAGRIIFLKKGFQKATMTQINEYAKTGYGTAYLYFRNKDELFTVLMENIMTQMYEVADLPFHPQTKQEAYAQINRQTRLFLQLAIEEKDMMRLINEATGVSAIVHEKWNHIRTRFITGITKDITYVQQAGLARKNDDASLLARGWFYMNEQLMWDLVLDEISGDINNIATTLTNLYTEGVYR
ncbi:TetR/AcrR family transcriptional regulator [Sporosarcina sp. G11-34]|uniref:TetR/AcrR family transcriptional regulator n=1 Tax=Sporosarcina sp. G11-34 TaxID=2849605 RepID=UPI0022A8D86B|nr:TetR/AcrR family transcriptional regulator [Sporosarcina sp. G11-34]MCZ2260203.1 TetR/AcrR family transcriptional regulator [Sporosarcina sp. G11-34]